MFQGRYFKVYGTNENPLFLVNDIICDLLGMDRPTDNRFFQDHKQDYRYVMMWHFATSSYEHPGSSAELQDRFKKSNKDYIYFFTEKGLYKCLMRSNKPIAELFQDEICDMLKNIRLGVISLYVEKEQEYIKTVEELKQYNTEKDRLLALSTQEVDIYEISSYDGKKYIGSSLDAFRRFKYHRYNSCNRSLNYAFSTGEVQMKVLKRIRSVSRDDIKYAEAQAILSVPYYYRMNIYVPRYNLARVTLEATAAVYSTDDSLSTVYELNGRCICCRRITYDLPTKTCEKCLESHRYSKKRKASEYPVPGFKLCPRCSCSRNEYSFVNEEKTYKTCITCRYRNVRTNQKIRAINEYLTDTKLCILCHKDNTNGKGTCDVCLEKKRVNRKRCQHNRVYDQCGEGNCINNASNMCRIHRVRNPCVRCKNAINTYLA